MFTRCLIALALTAGAALAADPLPQCTLTAAALPQCTLAAAPKSCDCAAGGPCPCGPACDCPKPALTLAAVNQPAEQRHESLERRVESLEKEVAELRAALKLQQAQAPQPAVPQSTIPAAAPAVDQAVYCPPQQPVTYYGPISAPVPTAFYGDVPMQFGAGGCSTGACAGGSCGGGGQGFRPFGGFFRRR